MAFKRTSLTKDGKKRIQCPNCGQYIFTFYMNQLGRDYSKHCRHCSYIWNVTVTKYLTDHNTIEVNIHFKNLKTNDSFAIPSEAPLDDHIKLVYNQNG